MCLIILSSLFQIPSYFQSITPETWANLACTLEDGVGGSEKIVILNQNRFEYCLRFLADLCRIGIDPAGKDVDGGI